MAKEELIRILKSGVTEWNAWLRDHPHTAINLNGAGLTGTILSEAQLARADLSGAELSRVNLNHANLSNATLTNTNLSRANLTGVDLSNANLRGTDLSGASLRDANLTGTSLRRTDLTDTDLGGATLYETVFVNVTLNRAIGLDHCQHRGPSILDHRTLMRAGRLPLTFLRGCGLPDRLIEYLPSLTNRAAIQFYSCFISYSTKDQDFADRLHADLQDNGVRCWLATEDLKIGDPFRQRIDDAIRLHDKLLLILSEHSVNSGWVRDEVEAGMERERRERRPVLFPVQLDDAVTDTSEAWAAAIRRQRHIGDFRHWKNHDIYIKGFDRLLRDLKADVGEAAST